MITQTFLMLDRVNLKTEKILWLQGIDTWDSFLETKKLKGISKKRKVFYDLQLNHAKKALRENNSSYFTDKLPSTETWRLYNYFRDEAVFLDIETSGPTKYDDITVIGLFDGIDTRIMINNYNLDIKELKKELGKYKLILTFNGSSFDLPFLQKKYPDLLPKVPHIDLRHLCNKVGLTGGLKEIEQTLGIKRLNPVVENLYGGDPFCLWRMFRATGDKHYLDLLVEYNEEDVINLKTIAEYVIKRLINEHKR